MAKTKNNQQIGKTFEQEWLEHLHSRGMWAHFMHPAPDGSQPFDVLSVDDSYGYTNICAWDCKTESGKRFPLSRVEDNQRLAFEALNAHGVHNTYFVIKTSSAIYLIPSQEAISRKDSGKKSIPLEDKYVYMYLKQNNN